MNGPYFKKLSQSVPEADDSFKDHAACRDADPAIFFPPPGGWAKEAYKYCADCPVTAECLDYALTVNDSYDFGIWGGTNAHRRHEIEKERVA